MAARGSGIGRHRPAFTTAASGRHVRSRKPAPGERITALDTAATLRAAAGRRLAGSSTETVLSADLREKEYQRLRKQLILFLVDASGSMSSDERMAAAKGAVMALLNAAYQNRDRIGLIAFRGETAEVLLPPTSSVALAGMRLRRLPSGGATPLNDGLLKAWELVKIARSKEPGLEPLLVLLSDGRTNVSVDKTRRPREELRDIARLIRRSRIHTIAIDTSPRLARTDHMRKLAHQLNARYHYIDHMRPHVIVGVVREAQDRILPGNFSF